MTLLNIKHLTAVFFWILILISCKGRKNSTDYFTGTVAYAYAYESSLLNIDSLIKERPVKAFFRYDSINYLSRFFGLDTVTYYYSGKMNKALSQINSLDSFTCEDYGLPTDSIISWKLYPSNEKLLNQECNILEIQKKNSWVKYYVSKKPRIAPGTYLIHKSYNMDLFGLKADGGLILKLEHRFKYFTMKGLAIEICEKDKQFKAFEIADTIFNYHCKK